MENNITKVWEKDGKLYGRTAPARPFLIYNLQCTLESILEYDFSNVVEGRELVKQYIKSEDTNAN